jgi:hypothetical protein
LKTIRKIIKETVDKTLEERGLLTGDLSEVLADRIWTAVEERKHSKGDACPLEWMSALMKMCGANPYSSSVALRSQISDCGKALIQAGAELGDLEGFARWWKTYTAGWSISATYPTPKQVRDNWGKYLAERVTQAPVPTPADTANRNFSQRL